MYIYYYTPTFNSLFTHLEKFQTPWRSRVTETTTDTKNLSDNNNTTATTATTTTTSFSYRPPLLLLGPPSAETGNYLFIPPDRRSKNWCNGHLQNRPLFLHRRGISGTEL